MLRRHLYLIIGFIIVAIWAETFVSSKVLLTAGMTPADIFFIRFSIAYLCLLALSHRRLWSRRLSHELWFMLSGVMGGSLYFLTENMALRYSTASNVAILVGTTPIVTAILLSIFYRDERMTRRQVLGSLIAFLGLVLVVLNGQFVLHLNPLGDLLALSASVSWGFYSLAIKKVADFYDARFVTRKVFGYGLLTILPWFFFVEPLHTQAELLGRPVVWGNLLYLALVASMGCFLAWNWILPRLGFVRATNIVYTQCVFTMIISYAVLSERITLMAVIGTLVLIGGMAMARGKSN